MNSSTQYQIKQKKAKAKPESNQSPLIAFAAGEVAILIVL